MTQEQQVTLQELQAIQEGLTPAIEPMDQGQLNILAQDYFEAAQILKAAEEHVKELKEKKDQLEERLHQAMTTLQISKMSMPGLGTFSMKSSTYWNIVDQHKLVEYLEKNAKDMIKIHPQNIRGWANDFRASIEDGLTKQPEYFAELLGMQPYDKVGVGIRKE